MVSVADKLAEMDSLIDRAARAVEQDRGASPVLRAVVEDLRTKSKKALNSVRDATTDKQLRIVVELEQAADSAKAGAQADPGLSEEARAAVRAAHDPICGLKMELMG